jgi:hypothetical protein
VRFGTCKERSLYRSGSLEAVDRELVGYKLDLGGTKRHRTSRRLYYFHGKGRENDQLRTRFLVHQRIVKRVEFVSDRMSYIVL